MRRTISLLIIILGIILLGVVVVPFTLSQLNYWLTRKTVIIDPSVRSLTQAPQILGTSANDLYSASQWFPGSPKNTITQSKVSFYKLSIPSVNIENVSVEINGDDLFKGPIQYLGTALPGTYGNTVIFGHSTSPFLYKVGNPLSVFNPLLKIKTGDDITIVYDGIIYRYRVQNIGEMEPDKIEVLAQRYDKYELTLVTCTPLGTYLRRFVVRAELVN